MNAHERLTGALYQARKKAGLDLGLTQLMRMVLKEIARLRNMRVPWLWIGQRLVFFSRHNLSEALPSAAQVEEITEAEVPLSSIRSAFLRLQREANWEKQTRPRVRAGPKRKKPSTASPAPDPHQARDSGTHDYFNKLDQLNEAPP
jgi:hypothetical protein